MFLPTDPEPFVSVEPGFRNDARKQLAQHGFGDINREFRLARFRFCRLMNNLVSGRVDLRDFLPKRSVLPSALESTNIDAAVSFQYFKEKFLQRIITSLRYESDDERR